MATFRRFTVTLLVLIIVAAVPRSVPTASGEPGGVMSAGGYHTCALTAGGGLMCWGYNDHGQVGDGTTGANLTPVNVSGLTSNVTAVAAAWQHTCAPTTGGGVKCWGDNYWGQLGNGTAGGNSALPLAVSGLSSGVLAITGGEVHTCVLTTIDGVKCWGHNSDGQLGDGTTVDRPDPVDVFGLSSGVISVAGGSDHTCALMEGGAVKCWGHNFHGQLGDGTNTTRSTPVQVSGLGSDTAAITTGGYHTCALSNAGGVKCWGDNSDGQLGDGTFDNSDTPVVVLGIQGSPTTPTPTASPSPTPTATPTSTPTPVPTAGPATQLKGDVDCSGGVSPVDSLKILRYDAGLSVAQEVGCALIGTEVGIVE